MSSTIATGIMVVIFLLLMVGVGVYTKKFVASSSDFLLAGRELSYGVNMMGVVASGFAGTTISLAPGLAVRFGLMGTFMFAFCYALCGVCLYGLLFARTIRRSGAYTLPEWLEMRYDGKVRTLLSILGLVGLIAVTANNVLALANVLSGYFGWSTYISIAIGVLTFLLFTYFSGMWGVSLTDFIQALIGCVGAPLLLITCVQKYGGISLNISNWGGEAVNFFTGGITGASLNPLSLSYPSGLTMLLLYGVFLVWGGQHYWIRMAGARSENQAKYGYVIAGILLFFVTMLIGTVGLMAGANHPEVFNTNGGSLAPEAAYGFVIGKFPPAIGSFLLLFALAASLSTAASTLIAAVSIALKDIYQKLINKNASESQLTRGSRIATITISLVAWGLAYYPGGTTFLFAFATAWMAPAGLLFALGLFWRRCTAKGALAGAVCGAVCETIWALLDMFKVPIPFLGGAPIATAFHMGVVGVVTVLLPAIIVSLYTKPKYYGQKGWTAAAEADGRLPNP